MSEGAGIRKTRTVLKEKTKAKLYERRIGLVLSLTGGMAQIRDIEDHTTFEIEIPAELKGKGIVEPGKKMSFLYHNGKYKIEQ